MTRPLVYSINVTLDGCVDHRAGIPNEDVHRRASDILQQADALLFGRVTYKMMEEGWRHAVPSGSRPEYMDEFARTINSAKKYVVSSTLTNVEWNTEIVRGDLKTAVEKLKSEPGTGLYTGGVTLPLALSELGLIDEYIFLVQPRVAGHGPYLLEGLRKRLDLELRSKTELPSGIVEQHYRPISSK